MEFGRKTSWREWSDNHLVVYWPHHVAKNNSCCRFIFLCLVVKRKAAQVARVHRFRAQQCKERVDCHYLFSCCVLTLHGTKEDLNEREEWCLVGEDCEWILYSTGVDRKFQNV